MEQTFLEGVHREGNKKLKQKWRKWQFPLFGPKIKLYLSQEINKQEPWKNLAPATTAAQYLSAT